MKRNTILSIASTVLFLVMVIVNYLAVALPINGITPGEVSDSYPNLFAPAGFTFSIWGLIYTLLLGFTVYQWIIRNRTDIQPILEKVQTYFILSSLFNTAWVFAWHYQIIPLSLLLIVGMLISLILINVQLRGTNLKKWDYVLIRLPFSIYFGWLTVATIANVTVLMVSLGWNGYSMFADLWTALVLLVGTAIGILTMLKNRDIPYILVLIWAYFGIFSKHMSANGFHGQYPLVSTTALICIGLFVVSAIWMLLSRKRKKTA